MCRRVKKNRKNKLSKERLNNGYDMSYVWLISVNKFLDRLQDQQFIWLNIAGNWNMRVFETQFVRVLISCSLRLFVVVYWRTGWRRFTRLCFKLGHNFMHFANCLGRDYSVFHGCVLIIVDILAHARALLICIIWVIWGIFLWTRRLLDDFVDDLKLSLAGLFKLAFFKVDEVL